MKKKPPAGKVPPDSSDAMQQAMMSMKAIMMRDMSRHLSGNWFDLSSAEPTKPIPPSVDIAKLESLKTAEPYKVTARMPDYVQVITAWRAWAVRYTPDGLRLEALGQDNIWEPKKAIEATCQKRGGGPAYQSLMMPVLTQPPSHAKHPAPQMNCTCGVWAFKQLDRSRGRNRNQLRGDKGSWSGLFVGPRD